MNVLRVALVSSWGTPCGIAEHSAQLMDHGTKASPGIRVACTETWLDPEVLGAENPVTQYDVVHLNYHRGLHSRWTPGAIRCFPDLRFVITFHDTYETQPDDLPWDLLACENVRALVVHEPCDLDSHPKVRYWRQAVPERVYWPTIQPFAGEGWRPTLGTLGFDFPWKNYDLLAKVAGDLGWNLRVVGQASPGADISAERKAQLLALNPRIHFDDYLPAPEAVAALESCDATAFMYECANSGTSGAIRMGIAAGKPLIATSTCRQFRDLRDLGTGIIWTGANEEDLRRALTVPLHVSLHAGPGGYDMRLVRFAHEERWELLGKKYAQLYRDAVV